MFLTVVATLVFSGNCGGGTYSSLAAMEAETAQIREDFAESLSEHDRARLTWCREGALILSAPTLTRWEAEQIGRYSGDCVYLSGLQQLTPELAGLLASFAGERLYLDGLTSLEVWSASHFRSRSS